MRWCALSICLLSAPANAQSYAPYEWMSFCASQPSGCDLGLSWTPEEVAWVHASVNAAMIKDKDAAGPWAPFPDDKRGNCADFVVTYRSALEAFGLDASLTRVEIGYVGDVSASTVHAVLVVDLKDGGEWVMDALADHLYRPDHRPYTWIPIASQATGRINWTSQGEEE